jgi:hypothetical protein
MKAWRSWSQPVLLSVWMLMLLHAGHPHAHDGEQHAPHTHQTEDHNHACWWCEVKLVLHELVHHHDHPPMWDHIDQFVVDTPDVKPHDYQLVAGLRGVSELELVPSLKTTVDHQNRTEALVSGGQSRHKGRAPPANAIV